MTRLRARIVYSETPEPCGSSTYGEVEDYSVYVFNWLNIDPVSGSVLPGDTTLIGITLDATGLEIGDYIAELRINSNDPDNPLIIIPITLHVRNIAVSVSSEEQSVCAGEMVQLHSEVTGGSDSTVYAWSSIPEGFTSDESDPVAYPDTTTTYILQITDGELSAVDQVTVTVFPLPEVSLGGDMAICEGDSVTLDAGEGHTGYMWSTGDTTQMITVMDQGQYWVQVANEYDCTRSDTMQLTVNTLPVISLGNDTVLCYYHTLQLDAGNPGSAYAWSTGDETQTITVDTTGMVDNMKTIKVEVTTPDECMSADSITINFIECLGINEMPKLSGLQVYPVCSHC